MTWVTYLFVLVSSNGDEAALCEAEGGDTLGDVGCAYPDYVETGFVLMERVQHDLQGGEG